MKASRPRLPVAAGLAAALACVCLVEVSTADAARLFNGIRCGAIALGGVREPVQSTPNSCGVFCVAAMARQLDVAAESALDAAELNRIPAGGYSTRDLALFARRHGLDVVIEADPGRALGSGPRILYLSRARHFVLLRDEPDVFFSRIYDPRFGDGLIPTALLKARVAPFALVPRLTFRREPGQLAMKTKGGEEP